CWLNALTSMPNEFARVTNVLVSVAINGCVGDVTRNAIFLPCGLASASMGVKNDKPSAVIKATASLIMFTSLALRPEHSISRTRARSAQRCGRATILRMAGAVMRRPPGAPVAAPRPAGAPDRDHRERQPSGGRHPWQCR